MEKWEANVRRVTPYTPGEQPAGTGIIKLNTNENPYPPSPAVAACLAGLDAASLRRYPQPGCDVLKEALAAYHGLDSAQIFTGVGSDDVLAMCFLAFFNGKDPVLFPDITYSFYEVWAEVFGIPVKKIPLREDFTLDPADYESGPCGGLVFPNPNAPTGMLLEKAAVERMAASHPEAVVIVDEAYIDFGGESAIGLIGKYSNLLVVQTFSKSRALAGMRIGCAFGCEKLIRCLEDVKYSVNSYTLSTPALLAGAASVKDEKTFRETAGRIIRTRERTKAQLEALGFSCTDSRANFLFAAHKEAPAEWLLGQLKERNIYVRHFGQARIRNYLRITVGTEEEMETLIRALREILAHD